MKRNETLSLAGAIGLVIAGVVLCTILFQQMALYVLNNALPNFHH